MKLLVLHLSDIHISSERFPDNPVLARRSLITAAVRSVFLNPDDVAGCVLMVTGDVAFAGRQDEYELATPFFRAIQQDLKELFPKCDHHTFFIPGNHDCDFDEDDQARQKLIDDPDPSSLADGSIITTSTMIQQKFFEFLRDFRGATLVTQGMARLYCAHDFEVAGRRILVRTLNSAWASRMPESRTLMLPVTYLADHFPVSPEPAVAITAIHHPYNWFEPNNGRALRRLIEECSDVILTGHEHSATTYTKTGLTGEQNEYIEGGVLQESGDPASSTFNVIVIDLASETQEIRTFVWNGALYEFVNDVSPQPFIRNKFRLRGEFELADGFEDELNDPEATYMHPQKDRIRLDDIFIYPDVVELDEKHSKTATRVVHGRDLITHVLTKRHVLVTGAERAGKTAVARTVFKDLRRNGKIPLMLSGRDMKPSALKKLPALLDAEFNKQYRRSQISNAIEALE